MLERKSYLACVNRIYYGCFYEVTALMIKDNVASSKHTGVKSFFMQQYVKTQKVAGHWGSFYVEIFKYRQDSDYKDFVKIEEFQVKEWLDKAREFVETLEIFFLADSDKSFMKNTHE